MPALVRPLDLCLQYVARVKKQVARAEDQVREAREAHAQMEEKLAKRLRDLEALRAEASAQPRPCPEPTSGCGGGHQRGSHQVESSGGKIVVGATGCSRGRLGSQEGEDNRVEFDSCDAPPRGGGVENPSLVMSSLIEAADSALREAGRGAP